MDSIQSLSHEIDQASLEIMQRYDSVEERRRKIVRTSQETGGRQELLFRKTIPIQALRTNNPTDILHISLETASSKKEHLLIISNHYTTKLRIPSTVDVYRLGNETKRFYKIHAFSEIDPFELEYLNIVKDGKVKHLLAIAGNTNVKIGTGLTTRVVIYEIVFSGDHFSFPQFQTFGSVNVDSMKSATRNNVTYLVFGMRLDHSATIGHSKTPAQILVLVFNPAKNAFQYHSTMPALIISDIELFNVQNMLLMTVAYYQDKNCNLILDSPVYKLNDGTKKFELLQTIRTRGARDIEYFRITNGHFIVVANEASGTGTNKKFGVPSTVYQFTEGKYVLFQNLETYGAVRWKSTSVPNCQNSVLLFYSDRRDNSDQVGLYMFSDSTKTFTKIPLSFYHYVSSTFRPRPNTLVPFMVKSDLFVAIGATDTSAGDTIYQIEYSTIVNDSPWKAFAEKVAATLEELNKNLSLIATEVKKLEDVVGNIVYTDKKQNITGFKVFPDNSIIENLQVENLDVSSGSIYFNENGNLYKADPKKYGIVNVSTLEANALLQEKAVNFINQSIKNVLIIGNETYISKSFNFSDVKLSSKSVTAENVVSSSCKINEINICDLVLDTVFQNTTDVIKGKNFFTTGQIFEQNLIVGGNINGVKVAKQIVTKTGKQIINSSKTFAGETKFRSVDISGNVNGIDLSNDALSLNKDEVIVGMKTFEDDLVLPNVEVGGLLDKVDVKALMDDAMLLTSDQNVSGLKEFRNAYGVASLGNVSVSGLTNGIDLNVFAENVIKIDDEMVEIGGNKLFEDRIIVQGNVSVGGMLNRINFPTEAVLIKTRQNITGYKVFLSNVTVRKSIQAEGLVDGINMSDVVTLNGDDIIIGMKTFEQDIMLLENLNVAPTTKMNELDVSELGRNIFKIHGKQHISGFTEFQDIIIENDLEIAGKIDNITLKFYTELFRNAVLPRGDQIIHGKNHFLKSINVSENVTVDGLVNGLDIPESFLDKHSDQTFIQQLNFTNVLLQSNVYVNGTFGGVDLVKLGKEIITTDSNQIITGFKTFNSNLMIDGNITVCCAVNNILLSNLLTKNTEQIIAADKSFAEVDVAKGLKVIANNVSVESTVNGVDLSNITKRVHFLTENQYISNIVLFQNVSSPAGLLSRSVNDVDISQLAKDAVLLNTDQVITSTKKFTDLKIRGSLITNSTVDGIDVSALSGNIVMVRADAVISGQKVFKEVNILGSLQVTGLTQNLSLSMLANETVQRTGDHKINGLKIINGNVTVHRDSSVKSLNGLDLLADVVLKSRPQNISGVKQFTENVIVRNDVIVSGKVNGIDISLMNEDAVKKNIPQEIKGKKFLQNTVYSKGNVTLAGTIDGVDLSELNRTIIRINRDQEVPGDIRVNGSMKFEGSIYINGSTNGYNLTKIFNDAVTINTNQTITGKKTFKANFTVQEDLYIDDEVTVNRFINNVNITKLAEEVVDYDSNQTIISKKKFLGNVSFRGIEVALLDGLSVSEFVTTMGNQTIQGAKVFASSVNATSNVTVSGLVHGEKLNALGKDTLLQKANHSQKITGQKIFKNALSLQNDTVIHGTLDGLLIKKGDIITLDTEQNVSGVAVFQHNFVAENAINLAGLLSGINISMINKERVTLNTQQTIFGDLYELADMIVQGNISVNGTVSYHDLSEWPKMLQSIVLEAWSYGKEIDGRSQKRCAALNYVKDNVLEASPLNLDYFNNYQSLDFGINHIEPFKIGNGSYLAIARIRIAGSQCLPCSIMKYARNLQKFVPYQSIGSSGGSKFKAFSLRGENYLFLGNKEDGCLPAGYSILYKWSSLTRMFYKIQTIPTNVVTDAKAISYSNETLLLAIANADGKSYNSSVTIWKFFSNQTMLCLIQNISVSMPLSIELFEIYEQFYMAIALSFNPVLQSTRAISNIYKLSVGLRWELLQQVPTAAASDFAYFSDNQHHFLAVSNEQSQAGNTKISQIMGVEIYQFSKIKGLFVLGYSIPVLYSIGLQPFSFTNIRYMSVAVKGVGMKVYKFRPHIGYELIHLIPQTGITHHKAFSLGTELYLVVGSPLISNYKSNLEELSPRILKAQFSGISSSNYRGCI